jgi:hypothetical protein
MMEFPPSNEIILGIYKDEAGVDAPQTTLDALPLVDVKEDASSTITGTRSPAKTIQHRHEYVCPHCLLTHTDAGDQGYSAFGGAGTNHGGVIQRF